MGDYEYEDEDKELMVREAFHILTQGVEMTHYEVNVGFRKTYSVKPKVVWLNPDSLRLCVSTTRPPVVQTELYTGVYLRDVAEVVGGAHTFGFAAQPEPPSSNEQCLNLIASERTLCLQLPSEFSRNWFLERIRILCDDILTSNERSLRESIKWTNMNNRLPFKESHRSIAESTEDFLVKGITVLCHTPSGSINESTLFYSSEDRRLIISKLAVSLNLQVETEESTSATYIRFDQELTLSALCKRNLKTRSKKIACQSLVQNVPSTLSCRLSEAEIYLCTR